MDWLLIVKIYRAETEEKNIRLEKQYHINIIYLFTIYSSQAI